MKRCSNSVLSLACTLQCMYMAKNAIRTAGKFIVDAACVDLGLQCSTSTVCHYPIIDARHIEKGKNEKLLAPTSPSYLCNEARIESSS